MILNFVKSVLGLKASTGDDISVLFDDLQRGLDDVTTSLRECIVVLINFNYPNTIHCELDLYILI